MSNTDRRASLRLGYQELVLRIPAWIEQGAASEQHNVKALAQQIGSNQSSALSQIKGVCDPQLVDTSFIDRLIGKYVGFQPCLLGNDFVLDAEPEMVRFIGEKLDKAEEYLREFDDLEFKEATKPATKEFYEAAFGKDHAALAARLECVEIMLNDIQALMRTGLFPVPAPQYPSGSTCRSSSWVEPHPEIQ